MAVDRSSHSSMFTRRGTNNWHVERSTDDTCAPLLALRSKKMWGTDRIAWSSYTPRQQKPPPQSNYFNNIMSWKNQLAFLNRIIYPVSYYSDHQRRLDSSRPLIYVHGRFIRWMLLLSVFPCSDPILLAYFFLPPLVLLLPTVKE